MNRPTQEQRLSVIKGDKNDGLRYVATLDKLGCLQLMERALADLSTDEIPFNLSQLIANAFLDGQKWGLAQTDVYRESDEVVDSIDPRFKKWLRDNSWMQDRNGYYFRLKENHKWPPDEIMKRDDLFKQWQSSLESINNKI